ncbi:unnamed protein product [Protopolystoma xenopodis]|uniref:Uncharacterized protein n=1 Tax=Protopolystoma xenopodis TaxID=117903 RepID=A0A3S5A793_9PLAT|nr:unnamed protein product [Protopolystoma xenopodis]
MAPGIDYRPAAATENAPETRQKVSSPVITASDDVDGILCSTSEPSQLLPVDNKSDDLFPRALHYIAWTVEFVHSNDSLWSWVQSHGGWVSFIHLLTFFPIV